MVMLGILVVPPSGHVRGSGGSAQVPIQVVMLGGSGGSAQVSKWFRWLGLQMVTFGVLVVLLRPSNGHAGGFVFLFMSPNGEVRCSGGSIQASKWLGFCLFYSSLQRVILGVLGFEMFKLLIWQICPGLPMVQLRTQMVRFEDWWFCSGLQIVTLWIWWKFTGAPIGTGKIF